MDDGKNLPSIQERGAAIEELRLARKRRWLVMLMAYGDDSSDRLKERVFAASALVGTQDQWDAFCVDWNARNGSRPFHATDCDSDNGDFRTTSHEENKKLYADNIRLLVNSPLMGAGVSISIADYERIFPFDAPGESPYYRCFSGAISCAADIAKWSIPPERVKITFDQNKDRDYSAAMLYDFAVHHTDWESAKLLDDEISFANHRNNCGLQAADLLAREAMKELDNRLPPIHRWPRQSLIELRKSRRFSFICFDRPKLEEYRREADSIHVNPEAAKEYEQWRLAEDLPDSLQARLKFVMMKK